jgi:hypothetical protein
MIYKGYITETDGTYAKVVSLQDEIFDDVLLLYPYGFQSKVKPSESTLVLIFCALGSKTNSFAIPYDILTQSTLEAGEAEIKNRVSGNGFVAKETQNDIKGDSVIDGTCEADSYKVSGIKVVGSQQAAIVDPTGGVTVDSQARTAIIAILTALEAHGLIAT